MSRYGRHVDARDDHIWSTKSNNLTGRILCLVGYLCNLLRRICSLLSRTGRVTTLTGRP